MIACAAYSSMAPTALMMVHCVSSYAGGNHNDMEHMAEVLRTADRALCTAYTAKTGMPESEVLDMMDHETWLTARQAQERGLVDEVMFEETEALPLTASADSFHLPTQEQMNRVRAMMGETVEAQEAEAIRTSPGYAEGINRMQEIMAIRMNVGAPI